MKKEHIDQQKRLLNLIKTIQNTKATLFNPRPLSINMYFTGKHWTDFDEDRLAQKFYKVLV